MEEGESREPTTPFWARTDSSSSSSSSSNSSMKPLMAAALSASIFFIIFFPSILSSSFKASFRPSLFKNGWDLLNFVLVVFAVLCGVLGRNTAPAGDGTDKPPSPIATPAPATTFRRMRSSSYPDLRQEPWWGPPADDSWRFSDDIEVYRNHHRRSDHRHLHAESIVKTIQVDTVEVKPPSPVRSKSPPPPPPPPPPPRQHHHQPRRRQAKRSDTPPPPPPPPPTPPRQQPVIERKLHRKKSTGAKDIAAALALFYQKKRKRSGSSKIKKIHNSNDEVITDSATKPTPPPPPPAPPPPSSMFHNLFASSKKGSSKNKSPNPIRSSPPPPPPLPSLPISRRSATKYPLPPSPLGPWQPHSSNPSPKVNPKIYYSFSNSFELPPPPPPPPPPSLPPSPQPSFVKEAAAEPLFCPSPDVNNKAEMFIERFRAGLKLEKLNSIREKEKQQQQQEEQIV